MSSRLQLCCDFCKKKRNPNQRGRMNQRVRTLGMNLLVLVLVAGALGQKPTEANKTTTPQTQNTRTREFGTSYATLRPEQKKLVDEYVMHYKQASGSKVVPQAMYDAARMSVRTTFDAVTHALLTAKITDAKGKSLGHAIQLVEALDQVMGAEEETRGDRQFRMYVYLKPTAFDILSQSREFVRERDNTVYHKGFPICFRLKDGPPSIQVSISRDKRMADMDVDYRSSSFPKALFNGHLTAANSDVRAGDNLDRHDSRWSGLNGWWRDVFGSLGGGKVSKDTTPAYAGRVPVNPRVKSDEGIDASAHDFLKTWVVDRQPTQAIAYFSPRSYPCLEAIAERNRKPISVGTVRVRLKIAMEKFNASVGSVKSVGEAFEPEVNWSPALKEAKNAYPTEFRLVVMPPDMGQEQECVSASEEGGKKSKTKYFATALRGKQGDSRDTVMSLLWAEEGKYWKIVAIRVEDNNAAGIIPKKATVPATAAEPEAIAGDPQAVNDITGFYESWVGKRDTAKAASYASEQSYACMGAPLPEDKKLKPAERIRAGLDRALEKLPQGKNLSDMMTSVQPVNELVRPVEQKNSNVFAIMAVPDQMADSFLCQKRKEGIKAPELKKDEAKYGGSYLSASQLNFGEEESPALLLLWIQENKNWKVVAWAVDVP
jgi:hypothetical protein